jgi:hypothetical protein
MKFKSELLQDQKRLMKHGAKHMVNMDGAGDHVEQKRQALREANECQLFMERSGPGVCLPFPGLLPSGPLVKCAAQCETDYVSHAGQRYKICREHALKILAHNCQHNARGVVN